MQENENQQGKILIFWTVPIWYLSSPKWNQMAIIIYVLLTIG
jgi:hypothetical protein